MYMYILEWALGHVHMYTMYIRAVKIYLHLSKDNKETSWDLAFKNPEIWHLKILSLSKLC